MSLLHQATPRLAVVLCLLPLACLPSFRRPGPGQLDDGASCPWLGPPRTRGPHGYWMRGVEAGTYGIGCVEMITECRPDPPHEPRRAVKDREEPRFVGAKDVRVELTRGYWIGETEVTQRLVSRVTGEPLQSGCAKCPATFDRLVDAARFANALSERHGLRPCYELSPDGGLTWPEGLDCPGYRLPTAPEWEIAARAGCMSWRAGTLNEEHAGQRHPDGILPEFWEAPVPVMTARPNGLGLFDMNGNVQEWVWGGHYPKAPPVLVDPDVTVTLGASHVAMGGVRMWGYVSDKEFIDPEAGEDGARGPQDNPYSGPGWTGLRLVRTAAQRFSAPGR